MMLIIIGKTASGKSTLVKELCKNGYERITTYTTRPRRKRESKTEYHFVSEEEFQEMVDARFFAEWECYKTCEGDWYYGSAIEDYESAGEKSVIILAPTGARSVRSLESLDCKIITIYLYANLNTICKRLEERGDKANEIKRRIDSDNNNFKGVEMEVDRIVYNNSADDIKDVAKKVMEVVEKG